MKLLPPYAHQSSAHVAQQQQLALPSPPSALPMPLTLFVGRHRLNTPAYTCVSVVLIYENAAILPGTSFHDWH